MQVQENLPLYVPARHPDTLVPPKPLYNFPELPLGSRSQGSVLRAASLVPERREPSEASPGTPVLPLVNCHYTASPGLLWNSYGAPGAEASVPGRASPSSSSCGHRGLCGRDLVGEQFYQLPKFPSVPLWLTLFPTPCLWQPLICFLSLWFCDSRTSQKGNHAAQSLLSLALPLPQWPWVCRAAARASGPLFIAGWILLHGGAMAVFISH